jgi:hypothetical protein
VVLTLHSISWFWMSIFLISLGERCNGVQPSASVTGTAKEVSWWVWMVPQQLTSLGVICYQLGGFLPSIQFCQHPSTWLLWCLGEPGFHSFPVSSISSMVGNSLLQAFACQHYANSVHFSNIQKTIATPSLSNLYLSFGWEWTFF